MSATMYADLNSDAEFSALLEFSARIGSNASLVQGPGGNTSLKRDGVLWIKASGAWLSQARERPIMVPVRLPALLAALDENDSAGESASGFVIADLNREGLRPSIETTMHAVLPHRVVLHVHCVETIAWAVQADAREKLELDPCALCAAGPSTDAIDAIGGRSGDCGRRVGQSRARRLRRYRDRGGSNVGRGRGALEEAGEGGA
jgi:hypothetical protein